MTFHAHPDDEAIATGGTMAKAASEGHRVVLAVATRGEHGEIEPGVLDEGEALWERRVEETHRAAEVLGVARVEFLGYRDSGMMGEATNDDPECFWRADPDDAAARLARLLDEEGAEVLTVYDQHGGYGHPDHIQVHRVGVSAAALAGVPRVYEVTFNRDHILRLLETAPEELGGEGFDPERVRSLGVPEESITTAVRVESFTAAKRAAMRAHASQIAEQHFLLAMSDEAFAAAFGIEWFVRRDAPQGPTSDGPHETSLFDA